MLCLMLCPTPRLQLRAGRSLSSSAPISVPILPYIHFFFPHWNMHTKMYRVICSWPMTRTTNWSASFVWRNGSLLAGLASRRTSSVQITVFSLSQISCASPRLALGRQQPESIPREVAAHPSVSYRVDIQCHATGWVVEIPARLTNRGLDSNLPS